MVIACLLFFCFVFAILCYFCVFSMCFLLFYYVFIVYHIQYFAIYFSFLKFTLIFEWSLEIRFRRLWKEILFFVEKPHCSKRSPLGHVRVLKSSCCSRSLVRAVTAVTPSACPEWLRGFWKGGWTAWQSPEPLHLSWIGLRLRYFSALPCNNFDRIVGDLSGTGRQQPGMDTYLNLLYRLFGDV